MPKLWPPDTRLRMTASVGLQPSLAKTQSSVSAHPRSRWVVPLFFITFAVFCAVVSHGFLEADEVTHFLISRSVWQDWTNVLSIWGRIGCTGLYALVSSLGVAGSRLVAVGITVLVGWGTVVLLKQLV